MNHELQVIADRQGGVVTHAQALAAGYTRHDIAHLRRRKKWISIRRGAYVRRELFHDMSDAQRHLALVHAVARSLSRPAVVSHVSAAVLYGLPTWGLDLTHVHVTRADLHSPRIEAGVHHHAGELRPDDLSVCAGVPVTTLARTAIDTARISPFEASVVVADAAFHVDPAAHAAALLRLEAMRDWPGSRNAGRVVEFADGRAESVGESRMRLVFRAAGLPRPDLQREFFTTTGRLIGRVDFYFEDHRTIGEFDGKSKYGRLLGPGDDAGEVVWREKLREDELRRTGNEVERLTWLDVDRPGDVARRLRAAFARAADRGRSAA